MVEGEIRYSPYSHPGTLRLLSFINHTDSGSYGKALRLAAATNTAPDINKVLQVGTLKYGFGINMEQEIVKNVGVFLRLGWNDGKTEDFAFTAIDRLATGGVSVSGALWKRAEIRSPANSRPADCRPFMPSTSNGADSTSLLVTEA